MAKKWSWLDVYIILLVVCTPLIEGEKGRGVSKFDFEGGDIVWTRDITCSFFLYSRC